MNRRLAPLLLIIANAAIIGTAWVFRQTVVPGWKKGPLIDPASPYAPENAAVLFAVAACLFFNLYLMGAWALRRRRAKAWAPLLLLLGTLGITEAALRGYLAFDMVTYFRPHPTLQWVVRPNLRNFDNLKGGGKINSNADGMREVTVNREKTAAEFRILVLGDSSNFGHGVEGNEMWEAQLQDLLKDSLPGKHVEVLNGACPGWSTVQAITFMKERGLSYHPDIVIAGFNNDPGPEYLEDKARIPPPIVGVLNGLFFQSEAYLLGREVLLSLVRKGFSAAAPFHYTERQAGAEPEYGKLADDEMKGLVPRVSQEDFVANLQQLNQMGQAENFKFVWLNMPINRWEPDYVARYVNPDYRRAAAETATSAGFPLIDVDARWQRSREWNNFAFAHVFHPNPKGHRRMAEQIGIRLLELGLIPGAQKDILLGGPPEAETAETLRFGWSSRTPVHAHIGLVLQAHPELAEKHGIKLWTRAYASGKDQGSDIASGALDGFFTCEVPAIQMLQDRPDLRLVASPGDLGRIGLISFRNSLSELKGTRVGLSAGSTPAMDWEIWGKDLGATLVDLKTEDMWQALQSGQVDALLSWDPWVEDWLQQDPRLHLLQEREFRSAIALSVPWAIAAPGRGTHFIALLEDALKIAAADRPYWDAQVASLSGWSLSTVQAVADRNAILHGTSQSMAWTEQDSLIIDRAGHFALGLRPVVGLPNGFSSKDLVFPALLDGKFPGYRADVLATEAGNKGPGKGPPMPGKGPPMPGKGPPGKGPPPGVAPRP